MTYARFQIARPSLGSRNTPIDGSSTSGAPNPSTTGQSALQRPWWQRQASLASTGSKGVIRDTQTT